MSVIRQLFLKGSTSPWLARQMTQRRFVQRAVARFMPGENLEDAVGAAFSLRDSGRRSILTILGENVPDRAAAERVVADYEELVEAIAARGLTADLSVKPTHLGLDLGLDVAEAMLRRVVERAGAAGRLVAIDMESTGYLEDTLELYRRLRSGRENVGLCLQAYLHRTEADLESLIPLRPMIRLVKGAYREPPELVMARKADVDSAYLARARRLLEATRDDSGVRVGFGTHDLKMIDGVRGLAAELGVDRDAFEIQMLYGIRRDIQESLVKDGYSVRILVSYGKHWFPWYMRRLAERPANVWFMLRSVFGS